MYIFALMTNNTQNTWNTPFWSAWKSNWDWYVVI